MKTVWGCSDYKPHAFESSSKFCDHKYKAPSGLFVQNGLANNLGRLTLQLATFLGQHGWTLLLCNGGSVVPYVNHILREQQIKFSRARTPETAQAPLLMVDFRTDPTSDSPPQWTGHVEINGADTNGIYEKLQDFIKEHMDGLIESAPHCDCSYSTRKFRVKERCNNFSARHEGMLNGESNIGKWTMRLCDFMVDHVGEWDLVVCNSDNACRTFHHGSGDTEYTIDVAAREMQLVFRHRKRGRAVYMSAADIQPLGHPPLHPPAYWYEESRQGQVGHKIIPGTAEELSWIQEVLDKTFKSRVTRDRARDEVLADRFVAVSCIRSEHPQLWDNFAKRRQLVRQNCDARNTHDNEDVPPPGTMQCEAFKSRCVHRTVGNPANQAYLFHGTNPTAAVSILGRSFTVDLAGKGAGTMFGPGVYMAESSTKADEYSRDDVGGEYDGMYALLICRVALGRPFVTLQGGNFADKVSSGEFDCVLGDREKAVGTFREFVIFHEESIYPEYAVFYRRECEGQVIAPLRVLVPTEESPEQQQMI